MVMVSGVSTSTSFYKKGSVSKYESKSDFMLLQLLLSLLSKNCCKLIVRVALLKRHKRYSLLNYFHFYIILGYLEKFSIASYMNYPAKRDIS